MAVIRIGISGWRYKGWRGSFYPKDLAQRAELEYAAARFPTIEINGSFYSLQRPSSYAQWYSQTPPGFAFAVKGSRYITHMRRLRGIETALPNFLASGLFNLREKLGPLLWQLPPNFRYDAARLEGFFSVLPRDTAAALALARRRDQRVKGRACLRIDRNRPLRHALEVRHPSFLDSSFVDLLRRYKVALVISDSPMHWPMVQDVTADFIYMRLHGDKELYSSGYDDHTLEDWARRIRAWHRGTEPRDAQKIASKKPPARIERDVYCFFDNDAKVKAPGDALTLMRKLGLPGSQ